MRELNAEALATVSGGCDTSTCAQLEPFVELYPNLVPVRGHVPVFDPSPDPWRPLEISR